MESFYEIVKGVIYTQSAISAIYVAKNAIKNQTFCLYQIVRLSFSNANSEAGVWDIATIQVFAKVLSPDRKSQVSL